MDQQYKPETEVPGWNPQSTGRACKPDCKILQLRLQWMLHQQVLYQWAKVIISAQGEIRIKPTVLLVA